jgi:hypothetical protein
VLVLLFDLVDLVDFLLEVHDLLLPFLQLTFDERYGR